MERQRFQLTDEQIQELAIAYLNCKDGPTRTRFLGVRLYGTGYPAKEVLDTTVAAAPVSWAGVGTIEPMASTAWLISGLAGRSDRGGLYYADIQTGLEDVRRGENVDLYVAIVLAIGLAITSRSRAG